MFKIFVTLSTESKLRTETFVSLYPGESDSHMAVASFFIKFFNQFAKSKIGDRINYMIMTCEESNFIYNIYQVPIITDIMELTEKQQNEILINSLLVFEDTQMIFEYSEGFKDLVNDHLDVVYSR